MSETESDDGAATIEDIRKLARKLALYFFVPCIVVSVLAVYVGLANWGAEGPGFFKWSAIALLVSVWLFVAARRLNAYVILVSGAVIILIFASFAVFLVVSAFTDSVDNLRALVLAFVGALFGAALVRGAIILFRERAREREAAGMRNPYAELGTAPREPGDEL